MFQDKLEQHNNMSSINREMREIFDKVTALSKIVALCGEGRDTMLMQSQQTKVPKAKNSFAMRLHAIFTDRDISEEKLKNAGGLNIELARFKGYDSKLDIIYIY